PSRDSTRWGFGTMPRLTSAARPCAGARTHATGSQKNITTRIRQLKDDSRSTRQAWTEVQNSSAAGNVRDLAQLLEFAVRSRSGPHSIDCNAGSRAQKPARTNSSEAVLEGIEARCVPRSSPHSALSLTCALA